MQNSNEGSSPKRRPTSLHRPSKSIFAVSRSLNPDYPNLNKLQDVTKYNSFAFNVTHYRDYPNRLGTPKKPSRSPPPQRQRISISPMPTKLANLASEIGALREDAKKLLAKSVLSSPMRLVSAEPKIVSHGCGRLGFVMNDYHSRETNAGFSRNHQFGGGFYTH